MSQIYVIGHKSPDLDSVAAAIAYADLLNREGKTDDHVPAVAGEVNRETAYALEKFGFAKPEVLESAAGKTVVMVDHNEFGQAVDGMPQAKIVGVLDHHKMDFKYSEPIKITVRPLGSSSTMIAGYYAKKGFEIGKELAGLMLSAVLVDTVITKSPTTTDTDRETIAELARIAGIGDWQAFGMELFKVRSSVSELKADEIIRSDFKDFQTGSGLLGIGQVETVDLADFDGRTVELLAGLRALKASGAYHTTVLFITDILKEGSRFYVATDDRAKVEAALGVKMEEDTIYIDGIISRKKQVAPKFIAAFGS